MTEDPRLYVEVEITNFNVRIGSKPFNKDEAREYDFFVNCVVADEQTAIVKGLTRLRKVKFTREHFRNIYGRIAAMNFVPKWTREKRK